MKRFASIIQTGGFLLASTSSALAIEIGVPPPSNLPAGALDIGVLIGRTIGIILVVAAIATFVMLIWGGIEWLTSGGDKSKVESAQHRIQAALVGLFIVFAAWAIMTLIGSFFGFDITKIEFPGLAD